MNVLLLAGNSLRNKDWIHEVDEHIAPYFGRTFVHHYAHWENGNELIDFDLEVKVVTQEAASLQPYVIFAKSAGSVLAIKGIAEGSLTPTACLFVGLPLKLIQELNLPVREWLEHAAIPITIIQNADDPVGAFEEVKSYVSDTGATVESAEGNTHDYSDFASLKKSAALLAGS